MRHHPFFYAICSVCKSNIILVNASENWFHDQGSLVLFGKKI